MANLTELYLTDVAHYKDLLVTPGGDLDRSSGIPNLQSALFRRLITIPGSLVHKPLYGIGIGLYQNVINRLATQQKLANTIAEQFPLDSRVESVLGVIVDYDDNNPQLTKMIVRIKPVGLEELTVNFVPFGDA